MGSVHGSPAGLGRLEQLERHRDPRRPGPGSLGDPLSEPEGRERRLDRIGRPQVDPVLGGELEERELSIWTIVRH